MPKSKNPGARREPRGEIVKAILDLGGVSATRAEGQTDDGSAKAMRGIRVGASIKGVLVFSDSDIRKMLPVAEKELTAAIEGFEETSKIFRQATAMRQRRTRKARTLIARLERTLAKYEV